MTLLVLTKIIEFFRPTALLHVQDLQAFKTRCAALASSREEHNQKQAHMFADAVARLTKMPKFVVQVSATE